MALFTSLARSESSKVESLDLRSNPAAVSSHALRSETSIGSFPEPRITQQEALRLNNRSSRCITSAVASPDLACTGLSGHRTVLDPIGLAESSDRLAARCGLGTKSIRSGDKR